MRLVLDTSILVAAVRSDAGASRRLLAAGLEGEFTLLLSVPLMLEYEAVLTRDEHLAASGLTAPEIGELLDAVASLTEHVRLSFSWRPALRDADDDMVLEAAVNGRADALVTFNRRDLEPVADRFGVGVLSLGDTVKRLGL